MARHIPKVAFVGVMLLAAVLAEGVGPRPLETECVSLWYEGVSADDAQRCLDRAHDVYSKQQQSTRLRLRLTRQPTGLCLSFENVNLAALDSEGIEGFQAFAALLAEAMQTEEPIEIELTNGIVGDHRSLGFITARKPAAIEHEAPDTGTL